MPGGLTIDIDRSVSAATTTKIRCQKTKPAITPIHPMYTSPYYDRPITRTQRRDVLPAYVSYTHAARSFCSLANVNVNKRKQSNAGAETTARRIFKEKKKNRRHHDDDASRPPGVAIDTVPSTRPNSLPHLVNGTTNAQSAERTSTSVSSDTSRVG